MSLVLRAAGARSALGRQRRLTATGAVPLLGGAFALGVGLWNAAVYPPGRGFDAAAHTSYAERLAAQLQLPHGTGEFHIPPGFYLVAGWIDRVAAALGLGEPRRATQALNAVLFAATVLVVWDICRHLWPRRPAVAAAAAAFTALLPVAVKMAAMFHPEPLETFLTTLGVALAVRMLRRPYSLRLALGAGAALGAAQLVRTFALPIVVAVLCGVAAAGRRRELAALLAVAVLIPLPWYVRQTIVYGTPLPFNRPAPHTPLLERRPVSFYVDPGVPDVITNPYRPHFLNRAVPTVYSELWGDYFGGWRWNTVAIDRAATRALERQAVLGLLPTLLALCGCAAMLARSRRDPALLLVALIPLVGLASFGFFTVSYPSRDGDVLKAAFLLPTTVGWAAGFGFASLGLRSRLRYPVFAALVLCAVADIPFLVYGS